MKLFRTHYDTEVWTGWLSPEAFIVYAVSAAQDLGWQIAYITPSGFEAKTNPAATETIQQVVVRKTRKGYAIQSGNADNNLRDWKKNEQIVRSFRDQFYEYQQSLPGEEIAYRYEVIAPHFAGGKDRLEQATWEQAHKPEGWQLFLIPERGYAATPILVWLNSLYFLAMIATGISILEPKASEILTWGGNYGPAVAAGQWWRLFSAAFLHIGIMHLASNMIALVYVGAFLEPLIGTKRFILAYLGTALASSLFGLYVHPDIISAGASGAVFGMFGVMLSLLFTQLIPKDIRKKLLFLLGYYVVYNLLYGLKEGIDNAGHVGGLVSGLMFGALFYRQLAGKGKPADMPPANRLNLS